jgi:hypothetical protein
MKDPDKRELRKLGGPHVRNALQCIHLCAYCPRRKQSGQREDTRPALFLHPRDQQRSLYCCVLAPRDLVGSRFFSSTTSGASTVHWSKRVQVLGSVARARSPIGKHRKTECRKHFWACNTEPALLSRSTKMTLPISSRNREVNRFKKVVMIILRFFTLPATHHWPSVSHFESGRN